MKVLLIGNYAPDDQKSMVAFTAMLERELPRLGCEVRVRAPQPALVGLPMPGRLRKWAGYLDKFVLFPPTLGADARWADVVHVCDHSNAMYLPRLHGHAAAVLTCHDVIAIRAARGLVTDWHTGWSGRVFQRLIGNGFAHADRIACISEATRSDVLTLGLAPAERLTLVPHGLNNEFGPLPDVQVREQLAGFGVSPDDAYLLHVGHEHPRKNRMAVLRAFVALQQAGAAAPVRSLVFVGSALTQEMIALVASQPDLARRVHVLRDVSHERLRALYCGATALLFPSLQEGFGWPIIEAQACGCPVFTSDLAPMNDIGADAAVYVPPQDPDAIARAIVDAAPRFAQMRQLGLENATHYSAAHMALTYLDLYRAAIAQHLPGRSREDDMLETVSRR